MIRGDIVTGKGPFYITRLSRRDVSIGRVDTRWKTLIQGTRRRDTTCFGGP